jgi:hypothetical protein
MAQNKREYIIEIPDVHPSLNTWTRLHWHQRNALKQYWMQMVYYAGKAARLPKFAEPVDIFITYHHPKRTVDYDNYTPKFAIDGLKSFIVDDNIQWIRKLGWEFIKDKDKKMIIRITTAV